jgi:hypothetical protein
MEMDYTAEFIKGLAWACGGNTQEMREYLGIQPDELEKLIRIHRLQKYIEKCQDGEIGKIAKMIDPNKKFKRMRRKNFPKDLLMERIRRYRGNLAGIAYSINADYVTLKRQIEKQGLTDFVEECREGLVADAESALLLALDRGEKWAIKMVLQNYKKSAQFGWTPSLNYNNPRFYSGEEADNQPNVIVIQPPNND